MCAKLFPNKNCTILFPELDNNILFLKRLYVAKLEKNNFNT